MNKHSHLSSNFFQFAVLALALSATGSAIAATAQATSTSVVVSPIQIAKVADLSFGTFAPGSATGSVTIRPDGVRAVTGGVVEMAGATTAARFNVTGVADMGYTITLGGTSVLTSGSDTMAFTRVSDFSASSITSGNVAATSTLTGGAQSIFVGGVLAVAVDQPVGTYTGTVTATVDYN